MRVVFIGPPGAGKGTQSQRLLSYLNVPHVSTGELLRDVVRRGTHEGLQAESYMNQGMLVPDPIMIKLVGMRLDMPDCKPGCLLDGFPRTLGQAKALDDYLNSHAIPLDCVLELRVNAEVLIQRLAGRGREDDDPAVIRKRLQMYRERTEPLLEYYSKRGLLATINGVGTTDEVFQQIQAAVDQFAVRTKQSATNNPQPGP